MKEEVRYGIIPLRVRIVAMLISWKNLLHDADVGILWRHGLSKRDGLCPGWWRRTSGGTRSSFLGR